jgi:trigger factor
MAGFRPGKAPRDLVIRRYQKDVTDQLKAELLLESLEQLAEEHKLTPLAAPELDPRKIEFPKTGPLLYEFSIEVAPEFDVPDYKGLKIRRPVKEFTDEDVAREQERILSTYGQLVSKDGGADLGDLLLVTITSRHGDRVIGTIENTAVKVQPKLAFKDGVAERCGEQLQGARAGDTRVVDVTLSGSSADAGLAGQQVQASFAVKEVLRVQLPELTPEFLEGTLGVRSAEQLAELARVILKRRLEYTQRQEARRQVMEHFAATSQWDLPKDLLRRQAHKTLQRRVLEMRNSGMAEEEIQGRLRLLQQDVLQSTALALKEHFVLQKIAEVEKIEVGDEDIDAEIERLAEQNGESFRKVRARIEKDDLLDAVAAELIERKALDLILENARYEDYKLGEQGEPAVATVEAQAVPGPMQDPTAEPPEEKPAEPAANP